MANKFLDNTGLGILWNRIKTFLGENYIDNNELTTTINAVDEVKADKPQLDGVAVSVEEYVEDYVSNNVSGGTGTLPSQLDIYCGNSIDVMD